MPRSLQSLVALAKVHKGKTILPVVDHYLLKRNFTIQTIEEWVHPSGIGDLDSPCVRQMFLSLYTPIEKFPPELLARRHSPRTHRIFDNGTAVHLRWQWYCIESGLCDPRKGMGWEIPIQDEELGIRGHADIVVWPASAEDNQKRVKKMVDGHGGEAWPLLDPNGFQAQDAAFVAKGEPALIEVKSIHHDAWKMLHQPLAHHRMQALCYVAILRRMQKKLAKLSKCYFIYESKNSQDVKEFLFSFDQTNWNAVEKLLRAVQEHHKKNKLPTRLEGCKTRLSPRVVECKFGDICLATQDYKGLIQIDGHKKAAGA